MRLTDSTELRQYTFDQNHVNTTMPVVKDVIKSIQDWLEEHGFQICPVKKEKGTVTFKEVEEELPWNDKSIDTMVKLRECALQTLQDPKYCLPLTAYIDLLNVKSIKEGRVLLSSVYISEKAKRKDLQDCQERVMKSIKDLFCDPLLEEPKPSADGEEIYPYNLFPCQFKWDEIMHQGVDGKDIRDKTVSFVPWQRCPVCEGRRKTFDSGPAGISFRIVDCHCCSGSGVIPMKRETR